MRIIIAAIVGGIIMFMWGYMSHEVLPTKHYGIKELPNDKVVIASLQQAPVSAPGMYLFPSEVAKAHLTGEKPQTPWPIGPGGLLLYDPQKDWNMSGRALGIEFATNVAAALLLALMASLMTGSYGARALALGLMGVFAWLSISASHWNWYGYPQGWAVGELVEQGAGWLLSGFAIAGICKHRVMAVVM